MAPGGSAERKTRQEPGEHDGSGQMKKMDFRFLPKRFSV